MTATTPDPEYDPDAAPEAHNAEQDDEPAQAQTIAAEALDQHAAAHGDPLDSVKPEDDSGEPSPPDLIDHMREMESSGRIDMGAYRGEETMDDNEGEYGEANNPDPDLPSDAD